MEREGEGASFELNNIYKSEKALIVRRETEERPVILSESSPTGVPLSFSAMQNRPPRQFAQVSTELRISKAALSIHQGRRGCMNFV